MAYSEVFTGIGVVNQRVFTINSFTIESDSVYLDGVKLVRGIGYDTSSVTEPDITKHDTVTLTSVDGIPDAVSVLEIVTDYNSESASDPTYLRILEELEDIKTATIGSWKWDKSENRLTMYDPSGMVKFKFDVADSSSEAIRERRQDLEV